MATKPDGLDRDPQADLLEAFFQSLGDERPPSIMRPVFVGGAVAGWDAWSPDRTGVEAQDIAMGRRYANAVIEYARRHENRALLGYVLGTMFGKAAEGKLPVGGAFVEMGFLDRVAVAAMRGSLN